MLVVSGLNWARRHKREFEGIITVEDPTILSRRAFASSLRFHRQPAPAHLILRFFDLDFPLPSPHHQPWMQMAAAADIASTLEFARLYNDLLIHCKAGVARSAALALAILTDRLHDPQAALDELLKLRPEAVPNRHIVVLADRVLACGGELIRVHDNWDQSLPANKTRRLLCRMLHFYEFGVPITAAHERGGLIYQVEDP